MEEQTTTKPPAYFDDKDIGECVTEIMRRVEAIDKSSTNKFHKFNFRGIDSIYNSLHHIFAHVGVKTIPKVLKRIQSDRTTKSEGASIHTVVEVEYHFTATNKSTLVVGPVWGEAADTGDKSTGKAMAYAHKLALLQLLMIPTEDVRETMEEREPDASSPEAGTTRPPAADPIGPETANKIYTAFQAFGVTREQLHRKLRCADVQDVAKGMLEQLKKWREECEADKRNASKIFGGTGPAARAAQSQG